MDWREPKILDLFRERDLGRQIEKKKGDGKREEGRVALLEERSLKKGM